MKTFDEELKKEIKNWIKFCQEDVLRFPDHYDEKLEEACKFHADGLIIKIKQAINKRLPRNPYKQEPKQ